MIVFFEVLGEFYVLCVCLSWWMYFVMFLFLEVVVLIEVFYVVVFVCRC